MLLSLGVDLVLEADAGPHGFVEALALLRGDLVDTHRLTDPGDERDTIGAGRLTVVRGPAGAGATEVASGLAAAIAAAGRRVTLLDADEVAPALAVRLDLGLEPNLRNAIDAAEFGVGSLDDATQSVPTCGYRVICGLPNVAAWQQVRPGGVVRVARDLATDGDVVVDVSAPLDDVGGATRGRYSIARAMLAEADALVAVAAASPVGVVRLLSWVAEAHAVAPRVPIHVVVNRAPRDSFRRSEMGREIGRTFVPASLIFVPADRRVEAAAWSGRAVTRGSFTRAMARLGGIVCAGSVSPSSGEVHA